MENLIRNSALGLVFVFLIGCGSSNKTIAPSVKSRSLDEMVTAKRFKIDVEWARPLLTTSLNSVMSSGLRPPGSMVSQINVMGNGTYLKMEGDTIAADLSYFGERQMGGGYNSNAGIKFEGVPKDLEISKDENRQRYDINFTISEEVETYRVRLTLASNLTGTILIASSQRTTIRYEGKVSALDETEIQ